MPDCWKFPLRPWLVLTGLCLIVLAPAVKAQGAADHVAMGVAAAEVRDPGIALQHYQAALDQDSMNYEANWRAAMTLLTLAEQLSRRSSNPERDSLYALAERYAGRAVASEPARPDGHFALAAAMGQASLTKGRKERIRRAGLVRRSALRTLAIDPTHDGAHHVLGRWNAEIMRTSGLSRFFAKKFLGAGVFNQASWERAIHHMEKAAELDPSRIYHQLELARIYAHRKRYADANERLARVDSLPEREVMDSVYKTEAAALRRKVARR